MRFPEPECWKKANADEWWRIVSFDVAYRKLGVAVLDVRSAALMSKKRRGKDVLAVGDMDDADVRFVGMATDGPFDELVAAQYAAMDEKNQQRVDAVRARRREKNGGDDRTETPDCQDARRCIERYLHSRAERLLSGLVGDAPSPTVRVVLVENQANESVMFPVVAHTLCSVYETLARLRGSAIMVDITGATNKRGVVPSGLADWTNHAWSKAPREAVEAAHPWGARCPTERLPKVASYTATKRRNAIAAALWLRGMGARDAYDAIWAATEASGRFDQCDALVQALDFDGSRLVWRPWL
jgi:hypothetical protein